MDENKKTIAETEAYLAKIRKTVQDSRNLVEAARLRIEETDRMLASQGLTREEVSALSFTPEQKKAVNAELVRMGLEPLPDDEETDPGVGYADEPASSATAYDEGPAAKACEAGANFTAGDGDGSVENRKRKFNVMMQRFRM